MLFNLCHSTNNYGGNVTMIFCGKKVSLNLTQMLWWYFITDNWYKYDPTNSFEITYCIKNVFRNWFSLLKPTLIIYAFHHFFFISIKDLVLVSMNLSASNEILSPRIRKNEALLGQFDWFIRIIFGGQAHRWRFIISLVV